MASDKRIGFSSAYGQLILLVFLPILVLAMVGGVLVFYEGSRASRSEQQAQAEAVLVRHKPMLSQALNDTFGQDVFTETDGIDASNDNNMANSTEPSNTDVTDQDGNNMNAVNAAKTRETKADPRWFGLRTKLGRVQSDRHVQRAAFIDEQGQVLLSVGYATDKPWPWFDSKLEVVDAAESVIGTAYGTYVGQVDGRRIWLMVDMDNEPLHIARYRIALALAITGLLTLLILLLSLNIYAKRWITPIYEMRLQLQRTQVDTLYKSMPIVSNGELNLLQQDLVKTLRRLHISFQDLKDHAEQTEDDLRVAFDEMEMQNISIRDARDAAISTSQAKSAFLANISHELRTPLNSIDGFINLLSRNGNLNAEQELYVQTIRKSSAHLLALVNDVLDFSKIEAGKLVLDRHEYNLYDTIYDVADMLSPVAAEKRLRMGVLFYDDVPKHIIGDALRLKQVLTNLLGNAIKFTDSGEVLIRVSLDDYKDNQLMIAVQDSGKGITAEDQKLLFQSFSQGDPSITRQYGGTGLGLVISKQLTRLMGGDIGFFDNAKENIAKQGSTFWFSMPAQVDVLEAVEEVHMPLPVLAPLSNAGDEFHLLAWINHPASMQVLKASLRALPIQLTQANSLPGVLESLKEHGNYWDWVIVDNDTQDDMMALLKQIRLHYQGKLAVFGYQVSSDQRLLERYHANGLYEPLDKCQLYRMLDSQTPQQTLLLPEKRWQGITVLAVDDHLPNLLVLDALLTELGIKVVTANSGFEAIELVSKQQAAAKSGKTALTSDAEEEATAGKKTGSRKTQNLYTTHNHEGLNESAAKVLEIPERIDLIFMDIQMPRMSGREAAEQIRKIEDTKNRIPIIALTAHGLSDERDRLIAAGIDDYVGKPISQPQLLQVLQKWLGRSANARGEIAGQLAVTNSDAKANLPVGVTYNRSEMGQQLSSDRGASQEQGLTALPIIDWEDALTRSANKPELAAKLLFMMVDSIEQEKSDLAQAWEDKDRSVLAQIAHRILGASRYAGVPQLRKASQDLEDKCLLNTQHTTPAQFAMLQPSYEALQESLDRLLSVDLSAHTELSYHKLSENDMTWKMI
jgi:two-component system sensor histidine kinase BarA